MLTKSFKSGAYYNENNKYCAAWLRNLIHADLIAPGDVDERSIEEVEADDLRGYTQCHFFAGIGIWSGALQNAGWRDDRHVWTASCPCQPFSAAGERKGEKDKRHLWPKLHELIHICRPGIVFGEQVSSPDGLAWFDTVSTDCENAGYTCWAHDLCSAGVGAPNIRQRLYWVAYASSEGLAVGERLGVDAVRQNQSSEGKAAICGGGLGNTHSGRLAPRSEAAETPGHRNSSHPTSWDDVEYLNFADGKARPIKPGIEPLVARHPGRLEQVRAYGNALNYVLATEFIKTFIDFESAA